MRRDEGDIKSDSVRMLTTWTLGGYYLFEEELAEIEEERKKVIKRASLLLEYQLKQADAIFQETLRAVNEETEVTSYVSK